MVCGENTPDMEVCLVFLRSKKDEKIYSDNRTCLYGKKSLKSQSNLKNNFIESFLQTILGLPVRRGIVLRSLLVVGENGAVLCVSKVLVLFKIRFRGRIKDQEYAYLQYIELTDPINMAHEMLV